MFGRPGEEVYDQLIPNPNSNQTPKPKHKKQPVPTNLKEFKIAYSKIHCSELTEFLWKQAETHEKSAGRQFSTEHEM